MGFGSRNRKIYAQFSKNAQLIASGATTPLVWEHEEFDPYEFHAPNASDFVIPVGLAGFYTLSLALAWENNGLGNRVASIEYAPAANPGAFTPIIISTRPAVATLMRMPLSIIPGFQLQENDRVRATVFHSAGTPINVTRETNQITGFHMVRVS